jgi:hypothetical protein
MIRARIAGIGLMGPGLRNWRDGCPVLAGSVPFEACEIEPPRPQQLSARERRRTSYGVRLGLAVAQEAVEHAKIDPATLPTVFGWAHGDGPVMQRLLETLATPERYVSPTEFHNSVHNVAVGYWTIASGSHQPSSSIAAGIDTFAASLLKAMAEVSCEGRSVLLIVCGIPFPEPLNTVCPVGGPFGAAFVLSPVDAGGGIAELTLGFDAAAADEPARPDRAPLRDLWALNAAARSLPLLEAIASRRSEGLLIPYGPGGGLRLTVAPC